jgi:hypothetical protein
MKQELKTLNFLREQVNSTLEEYLDLCVKMSESERSFFTEVVLPGQQLKLTTEKRKFIEKEYTRICENIEWGVYTKRKEIETDVKETMHRAEIEFVIGDERGEQDTEIEKSPLLQLEKDDPNDIYDEEEKKEILREFKQIVIPKVHSDTSDTRFEVFDLVMRIYKQRDYLLMQAFTIKYLDEITLAESTNELTEYRDTLKKYSSDWPIVLDRLKARVEKAKEEMSPKELENPEKVKKQLRNQNREIRQALYAEVERIADLMNRMDELCQKEF